MTDGSVAEVKDALAQAGYLADESPMWGAAEEIAESVFEKEFFLYIGRHVGMPVCLEGALKLKEISYIPTDAYPAGEMKHGPIALLDEQTPVVVVATDSPVLSKVVSNIQEVRARGAHVIAVVTEGHQTELSVHAEKLTFPLLSDPDRKVLAAYGAFGEKKMYGKTVTGVIRSTFVVGADGKLEEALYNVRATGHVAKLRKDLEV